MFGSKIFLTLAGATTMLTAGVAQASEKPVVIATSAPSAPVSINLNQRYCIVDDSVTGSRIPRKECAPLGQWKDRGIDPTRMRRR
ncbi:hypothetical protein JAO74_06915 [Sphingomonas sp. BT553]|uniref:Uncharacterized protein n=2 Tax=Sphingomonas mollis TaxID=2795726 RepID=A0ABS0XNC1_9SPHN|nr:hypothetical protein [Sphingomonas sp. BT553]